MAKQYGEWQILETEQKFHNEFFRVFEDQVIKPNGENGTYATVKLKSGVTILALDEENNVYLTKQFRYATGKDSIEAIAGGVDGDEEPLAAAKREIKEEAGIEAALWDALGTVDMDTSIINSPANLFLARNLTFTETEQEGSENIKTVKVKLHEALRMVMNGEITHSFSCVAILKADNFLQTEAV